MKNIVMGILAHVDAGKTTLSEAILYHCGKITTPGRVDNQDAYLDTDQMEKERGITIFSKEAVFTMGEWNVTLLDTPGHIDFSAEMERTLQVLDYAILVISGADGVQGHTLTLWRLLERYEIPTFLFVNKMDQPETDEEKIMKEIKETFGDQCILFERENQEFYEEIATCQEDILEKYLEEGEIDKESIRDLIWERSIFPCYFGSALKLWGVEEFIQGISEYMGEPYYEQEFGGKVFKIGRDEQNNRLTYLKITGGVLQNRQEVIGETKEGETWKEKVNQIRIYSGSKYEPQKEAAAGQICAVAGLSQTYAGQGLGAEKDSQIPILEPVLTYGIQLPQDCSPNEILPKLRMLEEEEPELKIVWDEEVGQIQAQLMGEVQIEILRRLIWERFHVDVHFDEGKILYKETIENTVEGVGHFEPLRHYAEVHLLIEPGERGSGVEIATHCSEDLLDKNWQRLICTHLLEKEHRGVLIGAPITDIKITVVGGKAHLKHTEGGDFRQATYRAVRQGLMKAKSILLEPYYEYRLEIPTEYVGRAMTDMEQMHGTVQIHKQDDKNTVLKGNGPVITMRNYQQKLQSYTKGMGQITCNLLGYFPCHDEETIRESHPYDPELDVSNPAGSVFCSHGAGYVVPWYEVEEKMHLPLLENRQSSEEEVYGSFSIPQKKEEIFLGEEEIDQIFRQTYGANRRKEPKRPRRTKEKRVIRAGTAKPKKSQEKYLLVDGYNIVFAWEELNHLAAQNIDAARDKLMDILCNYQAYKKCTLILVFDAYKVKENIGQMFAYHNIHVVYTKEAETADQYIEKLAHKMGREYDVTVATSDGLEQLIIRGQGCKLISAREFYREVKQVEENIRLQL